MSHISRPVAPDSSAGAGAPIPKPEKVSDDLDRWLGSDGEKTLGGLIDLFGEKSFAILFVLLLGVPALPLPTGGATHVFEIIAALLALELVVGRDQIWLPQRWRRLERGGDRQQRFLARLIRMIRRLEREGWYLTKQRGSHRQFKHPDRPGKVTVPGRPNDELQEGTWRSIQRHAGWRR